MIGESGAEECDATGVEQSTFDHNKIINPTNDKSLIAYS